MDIRDRIKAVRNHFKLNQTEFGDRVGLSQSSITAIENGKREIPQHLIKVISVQFGVSEDWLQTEKGDMLAGDNEPNPDDAILSDFIAPTMNPKRRRFSDTSRGRLTECQTQSSNRFAKSSAASRMT